MLVLKLGFAAGLGTFAYFLSQWWWTMLDIATSCKPALKLNLLLLGYLSLFANVIVGTIGATLFAFGALWLIGARHSSPSPRKYDLTRLLLVFPIVFSLVMVWVILINLIGYYCKYNVEMAKHPVSISGTPIPSAVNSAFDPSWWISWMYTIYAAIVCLFVLGILTAVELFRRGWELAVTLALYLLFVTYTVGVYASSAGAYLPFVRDYYYNARQAIP